MEYIGAVKVGRHKPRKNVEMAVLRLPIPMKDKIGKYAHIFAERDNVIGIVFTDSKNVEHSGVQQIVNDGV